MAYYLLRYPNSKGCTTGNIWRQLLNPYSIADMINFHNQRFECTHDGPLIQNNFTEFAEADLDLDPIYLKNKKWIFIKEAIEAAVANR